MSGGTGSTLILRPSGLAAITFDLTGGEMRSGGYVVNVSTLRLGEASREVMEYAQRTGAEGGELVGISNPLVPLSFETVISGTSRADMLERVHTLRIALAAGGYLEFKPEDLPAGVTGSHYAYLPSGPGGLKAKKGNRWDGVVHSGGHCTVECMVELMTMPLLISDPDSPVTVVPVTRIYNHDNGGHDNWVTIPAASLKGDSRALLQITMHNLEEGDYDDVVGVYVFPRVHGLGNYHVTFEPGTVVVGGAEWSTETDSGCSGGSYQRLTPLADDVAYRMRFAVSSWTDMIGRHLLMLACRDNGGAEGDFEARGGWSLGSGEVKDATRWRSTREEWLGEWQLFSLGEMEFPGTQVVEVEEDHTTPYYELEVRRVSGGSGTFDVDFFVAGPVDLRPVYVDCSGEPFLGRNWLLLSNLEYPVQAAHVVTCGVSHLEFDGDTSEVNCGSDGTLDDLHDNAFTVEAWIRADGWGEDVGGAATIGTILDKTGSASAGWEFQTREYYGLEGAVHCATTMAYSATGVDDFVADGEWHHVAMTFDDAGTRKVRIFVDGIEVDYMYQQAGEGAVVTDASNDLYIGNRSDGARGFDGGIGWVRISSVVRYTGDFTPPDRCTLPTIDGNTVGQWIGAESIGSTIDNQEGTAALDGTQSNCQFACDCGFALQGAVKPLGLLPLANPGKEATDGYRLYFLWERREGTLAVDDDFSGYDANWEEIDDCDVHWNGASVPDPTDRTEGSLAQRGNQAATKTKVADYSGWSADDYFVCTGKGPDNDTRCSFIDSTSDAYRTFISPATTWGVEIVRKGDFSLDGTPDWSDVASLRYDYFTEYMHWDNWRWSKKDPASAQPNDFGNAWNYFLSGYPWFVYMDAATRCAGNPTPVGSAGASGEAEHLLLSNMGDARNVKVKARCYVFASTAVTEGKVGIIARCSDGTSGSEDCYALVMDSDADTLTLYKYVAGTPTALASVGFAVDTATWYWLGLECYENTITCYANATESELWDAALMGVTDTSQSTGKCGFIVTEGMGRFDEIEVWTESDRYVPGDAADIEVKALLRSVYPHFE